MIKDALVMVSSGTLLKIVQRSPSPMTRKIGKERKRQALTTIETWDDTSSEEEAHQAITRGCHHKSSSKSSHTCLMARDTVNVTP
jgi:hypothetical protein